MITKEVAAKIHNCYTEIENGEKMLEEMKKHINNDGEFEIVDNWGNHKRTLELSIPKSTSGVYSIHRLPMSLAVDAIKVHISNQKEKLEKLKDTCKILLA